jgi:O-antigen/teichoic acid export membrane protein
MLRALYKSAALRAAGALAIGGVAFTLGSLILARALPSREYGLVSLVIGVLAVATLTAPLGLDLVVVRRGLRLGPQLRRKTFITSATIGLGTAALSALLYHLELPLVLCIMIATAAGGLTQAAAAHFQGRSQFGRAVWILQLSNWALVPIGVITALLGFGTATAPCTLIAAAGVIAALVGWVLVLREDAGAAAQPAALWSEALSLVTIHTSNSVFLQLERLLLAPLVGVHELALFGVLAALVGSPFRMIQAAVLFTLIPGLRSAQSAGDRRRLLRREILLVTSAMVAGSIVIWVVAPSIAHWFLGGRYDLNPVLMTAGIVSGVLKVFSAFATAAVVALGQEKDLRVLSLVSWGSIGLAVIAAFAAAGWGLVGVLYGISAGWLIRSLVATWMAVPHLQGTIGASAAPDPPPGGGLARHG